MQSISLIDPAPIVAPTFRFEVVFSDPVSGVVAERFAFATTGDVTPTIDSVTGDGADYVVTVTNSGGSGMISLSVIDDDSIVDASLNPLGGVGNNNGDFASGSFEVVTTGSIAGQVINDLDSDGYADLGEPGIAGVTVYVDQNLNEQFDVGEPSALTQTDDPGTTGMDESGNYLIADVAPGPHSVRMVQPVGWQQTNPALRTAGSGQLSQIQLLQDNVGGNNFLEEVAGVTESPDGNFVYIAAYADNAVTVYSRDASTGALTRVQTVANGSGGVSGLIGAQSIAITQDSQHLYVVSALDDTLVMFARDQVTGLLDYLGQLKQGVGGVDGLNEATAVRASADGKNLYVAAVSSNSLAVFNRDPATGLVTFAQKLSGSTGGSFSVDLSADQRHVYLSSGNSNAVHVYQRDLATGLLTLTQTVSNATPGFSGLSQPWGISVSPDGQNVYVASRLSQGVAVLNRDEVTGHVSFNQFVSHPFVTSNPDPVSVLVSPDGHHVAVTYQTAGGLAIYSRNPTTGALSLVESYKNNVGGFNQLFGAWDVEFSNDGRSLYLVAAYDDAVYAFDRQVGDWVPTQVSASVSAGVTTTMNTFAAANLFPMLESMTYSGSTPVTADSIEFEVVFSEPVLGVDASDFGFGGSLAGATVSEVSGSGATYTVTVDLALGHQGSLSLQIQTGNSITDSEGQPLMGNGSAVIDVVEVDRANPTLVSATMLDTSPTNQTSLRYLLTFSEPVSGITTDDFSVVTNGLTGGQVDSVAGSGTDWTVTVSYASGQGTIELSLDDDDSILDAVGLPLDGVGVATTALGIFTIELSQIQGFVFSDLNDDGFQDAAEPGVGGMTLYLDLNQNAVFDPGEPSAITTSDDPVTVATDESGRYTLSDLVDGTYQVRWEPVAPWIQTLPFSGGPQTVPVAVANGISLANFGIHEVLPGSISGHVYEDANRNAQQDSGEPGVGGVTVYLDINDNGVLDVGSEPTVESDFDDPATTEVDESGNYDFAALPPGDYRIRLQDPTYDLVIQAAGWSATSSHSVPDPVNLSSDNKSIAKSPDNQHAVVFDHLTNNVIVYQLPSSATGTVSQIQVLPDQFGDTTNKSGDLTFSPNGAFLYILEHQTRSIRVYSRDSSTGMLTAVGTTNIPYTYSYSLQATPAGDQLYVGGIDHISRYDIDPVDGTLSFVGATGGVARVKDMELSADGTRLYAVDSGNVRLRVFQRDLSSGLLSQLEEIGAPTGESFSGMFAAELSADGNDLYFANNWTEQKIWHYRIQPDGSLQYAQDLTVGTSTDRTYPLDFASSADGERVFVSMGLTDSVLVLDRDQVTGDLTVGEIYGTQDPSGLGINESSSSMMIALGSTSVLRVNSRAAELVHAKLAFDRVADVQVLEGQNTAQQLPVDSTSPNVASIASTLPYVIGTEQLPFVVTFTEPVSGVDGSDFLLDSIGVTDATISSITDRGNATVFDILVDTGTGDGTIALRLADDDSIVDSSGRPLGGMGIGNGDASSSAVPVERDPRRSVTGVVFDDVNNNGIRDAGEVGAENAGVYLDYNQNGVRNTGEPLLRTPYDDASTEGIDEGGVFTFTDVPLGTFDVVVADYWFSYLSSPGHLVTAELGFENESLEVEIPATRNRTAIRGFVFEDLNQNGVRDIGEPGVANQRIYRDSNSNNTFDSFETNVLTSSDGQYEITPVPFDWNPLSSDFFTFRYDMYPAWITTSPVETGRLYETPDQVETFDVGLVTNATSIFGTVFDDLDGNGTQDSGELPVAGWTVFLDADADGVRDAGEPFTTSAAGTGEYHFDQLQLGFHRVVIEQQPGSVVTSASPVVVELAEHTAQVEVDFAIHANQTQVAGVVFDDLNLDGVQNPGELGYPGATVYVDANNNRQLDPGELSTVSAGDGSYLLQDVIPGQTAIRISLPISAAITLPNVHQTQVFVMHGSNQIQQVDPTTGGVIRESAVGGPLGSYVVSGALAFDGDWIYAAGKMNTGAPAVIVIDPFSFQAIDRFAVATGNLPAEGAAVLGNNLYLLNAIDNIIYSYDLTTRSQNAAFSIPDINATSGYTSSELDLAYSLGESADGAALLVRNLSDSVLVVDPQTGIVLDDFPVPSGSLRHLGMAGAEGQVFLSHDAPGQLSTLDASGNVLQTENLSVAPNSAAANFFIDHSYQLTLALDQSSVGNDFGVLLQVRTVSGIQFQDTDADGQFDAGEAPLAGITVYADVNDNGLLDAGEPADVSGVDGTYVLNHVPQDDVWIRRIWPSTISPTSFDSVSDLLVGPSDVADSSSPTGESMLIKYFDPQTGSMVREVQTEIPVLSPNLSTTDGRYIYTIDNDRDVLIQLTPQGGLVRELPIPPLSTGGIPYSQGPAVVGGKVYWITGNEFKIRTLDPVTGNLFHERPITIASALTSELASIPSSGNLVESPDGLSIWMFVNQDDRVLVLDPLSAEIVDVFHFPLTANGIWSAASFSGELFLRNASTNGSLQVFDQNLNLVRTIANPNAPGLGAASFVEYGTPITGSSDITLDQGYQSFGGTIFGVIGEDANGNGIIDGDDTLIPGVTVFIDTNGNDWPDAGEVSTVSAADGSYTLENLAPGNYQISTLAPAGYRASDVYTPDGRLFGVEPYPDGSSPTGLYAEFWEFNPINGDVLQHVLTDIPLTTGAVGLAFDGTRLLLVDDVDDIMYQLTTDGRLIQSLPLGEPFINPTNGQLEYSPVNGFGPAVVGGSVFYIQTGVGGWLSLAEYDPHANAFLSVRPVTIQYPPPPLTHAIEVPTALKAVTESADGNSILIATDDDQWFTLDPTSATATFSPAPGANGPLDKIAAATLGGEIYVADRDFNIHVFDSALNLNRVFNVPHRQYSLAGGEHRVARASVSVSENQAVSVEFQMLSTHSTISGTIIGDANSNRILDGGETTLAGVEVYLDLNRNGSLDINEPQQVTDATGTYAFSGLGPGEYDVRVVPTADVMAHAWTDDTVELFEYLKPASEDAVIQQIDPLTGELLHQFPSPYPTDIAVGLAVDANWLYLVNRSTIDILSKQTGEIVDSINVPGGTNDGLAIIGQRAFVVDSAANTIDVVDLTRRRLVTTWDLGEINEGIPGLYNIGWSLAEAADGENLAVNVTNGDMLIVDPDTGLILQTFSNIYMGSGAAGAAGELYEPNSISGQDQLSHAVRDPFGSFVRIIPAPGYGYVYGLGAAEVTASSHRVRVQAGKDLAGMDFGITADTHTVSGTQYIDSNQNGIFDTGEAPLAGVTVFVDYDGNGFRDLDEPFDVSGVDGSYIISGVQPGNHLVDTEPLAGYVQLGVSGSEESLIGVTRVSNPNGPPGPEYLLQIRFVSSEGIVQSVITTEIETVYPDSVTRIGNRLLVVDNGRGVLIQVALDGTFISETPLPVNSSGATVTGYGLAVIDQTVYLSIGGPNELARFDPLSSQFYGAMPISAYPDQPSVPLLPSLSTSVTESIDGSSLIVFSRDDDRVFVVDPKTARVTAAHHVPDTFGFVWSAAVFEGQYLVRGLGTGGGLVKLDANFQVVSQGGNPFVNGFIGGHFERTGVPITATAGTQSSVELAHRSTFSRVGGIVSHDLNGNGSVDAGEEVADAVVFLDSNRDGVRNAGEAWTQTDAGGIYAFESLLPGDYWVAVESTLQVTASSQATRLFGLQVFEGTSTIAQHDPITGQTLRSFAAPGDSTVASGLAVDQRGLYYSSTAGVWVLDPVSGETELFFDLPDAAYEGLTALAGDVFVLNRDAGTITRLDVQNGVVLNTLDINTINSSSHVFGSNLSQSLDGTRLFTRTGSGEGLVIHPDSGVIESILPATNQSWGLAAADGEFYGSSTNSIRVQTESGDTIRSLPVGYRPFAVAADTADAEFQSLHVVPDAQFNGQNFVIAAPPTFPNSSLSGTLWQDDNSNGLFDPNESGVAGRTVYLDLNRNGQFDAGEPSLVTASDDAGTPIDETGTYRFTESSPGQPLTTGDYAVGQVVPVHWQATAPASAQYLVSITTPTIAANLDFGSNPPDAPTDVTLSQDSIDENQDTSAADLLFASLAAVDNDPADTHSFELVTGSGDTDNARFTINANGLYLRQGESLDHESQSSYAVRIRVTDAAGLMFEKNLTLAVNNLVEVSSENIVIGDGSAQRSRVESLSIEFDAEVTIGEGAFTVIQHGDGGAVTVALTTRMNAAGHTIADLTFSGSNVHSGSLVDGSYQLSIDGSKIVSIDGGGLDANGDGITGDQLEFGATQNDRFFRFYGDFDGDRDVDGHDLVSFGLAFQSKFGDSNFDSQFDFDDDGDIDSLDYGQLSRRFLRRI
ncbi:beta-propeller fold lactonase family protein [Stieleria sp. TO1_6]|uniref:SdrD B-like domain-containing protein n=1 Tax=Stieleria tagensis TaxID=2956795 RepID=UPI00209B6496|nr:SdrD B-like domain-containing protein [Stieleria tagensis]MCO8124166.1 beta-propeller fold lactonase family protein [Stieleria tagensis]